MSTNLIAVTSCLFFRQTTCIPNLTRSWLGSKIYPIEEPFNCLTIHIYCCSVLFDRTASSSLFLAWGYMTDLVLLFYPVFSFLIIFRFSLCLLLLSLYPSPSCSFPLGWCSVLLAAMCSSSQLVFPLIYSSFISGRHTCQREGVGGGERWGSWCYQQVEISPPSSGAQCGQKRARPEGV